MWWTFQQSTGMTTNIHRIFAEWLICATAVACCLRVHACMCMLLLNKLIIHRPVLDCTWGQITAGLWAFKRQTREPPPQRLKEKALHCSRWQHLHLFRHSVMTQQQTKQETRQKGRGGGSRGAYLGANCYIVVDTAVKKRQRVRGSQGKLEHRMSLTEVSKKEKERWWCWRLCGSRWTEAERGRAGSSDRQGTDSSAGWFALQMGHLYSAPACLSVHLTFSIKTSRQPQVFFIQDPNGDKRMKQSLKQTFSTSSTWILAPRSLQLLWLLQ